MLNTDQYESPVVPFLISNFYVKNNKWPYQAYTRRLVGPFLTSNFLLLTSNFDVRICVHACMRTCVQTPMYVCLSVCMYICVYVKMRV